MGVLGFLRRGVELFGARPCLVDDVVSHSYREVGEQVERLAAALAADIAPDRRGVAVLSPNSVAAFEAMLAVYRAGAVFVPLNVENAASENAYILEAADVGLLFFHPAKATDAARLATDCPGLRTIGLDGPSLAAWLDRLLDPAPEVAEDRATIVSIYSTGGTTGRPKGVEFTAVTWEIMAANFLAAIPAAPDAVYLLAPPFTHGAGTIALPLLSQGATIVIQPRFEAEAVLAAIPRHRVTHLWLPPTAIYRLLASSALAGHDYGSLRYFLYSASPMAVEKLKRCLEVFGPVMVQVFGQTEAPVFCTCLTREDHLGDERRLASCGRPMLLTPVEVMDDDGRLLPAGMRGEIVVGGNLVMAGYHKNAEATAAAMTGGWLRTGDVGYKDADGYVFIVDRKKQMIISGGLNVYPAEIEQVLLAHPAVEQCAVIGVPDDDWGEAIKAVVELQPGATATAPELQALCRERLGPVKTPKSIDFRVALPRTSVGKIDKKSIRDQYWRDSGRSI